MRGESIAQAYAALDAGDASKFESLLDPQARWIGVPDSAGTTPT